jgi:hypothetical protein
LSLAPLDFLLRCSGSQNLPRKYVLLCRRGGEKTHAFRILFKSISALGLCAAVTALRRISHAESESWTTAGDYQVRLLYLVCRYLRVSSVHTLSFSLYTAQIYTSRNYPMLAHALRSAQGEKYHSPLSAACIILALYIPHRRITNIRTCVCVCVTSTTKQGSVFTINLCAVTQLSFTCIYIYKRARAATKEIYRCQSRSESFHSLSPPTSSLSS